jgi:hypothetical protein
MNSGSKVPIVPKVAALTSVIPRVAGDEGGGLNIERLNLERNLVVGK